LATEDREGNEELFRWSLGRLGKWADKYNAGQRNGTFAFREFRWLLGIVSNYVVAFESVEGPVRSGIVERQSFDIFQPGKVLSPLGNDWIVAYPDFVGLGVKFVSEAEGQDVVPFIEKVVSINFVLRVRMIGGHKMRKIIIVTNDVVWHVANVARVGISSNAKRTGVCWNG